MAIANDFFSAAYPEPWQVLGVKLRPFSLGHYIKLSRLGCAFVSEQEEQAKLSDLMLGVIVCSMPSTVDQSNDPFWQWLNRERGGFRYTIYKLCKKLLRKPFVTPAEYDAYLWGKKCQTLNLPEKVQMFVRYMDECSSITPYVEENNGQPSKTSGAHWSQTVLSALVSKCGYTMEDALNAPISRSLSDFIKQAESDGVVRILPREACQ